MTDPTRDPIDARMRAALRGLPLPEAPETLRHTLETLPGRATAPGESSTTRSWSPGLAIAAVVVIAVLGIGGLLGLTRLPATPGTTDAPTANPSAAVEPPASVTVLDAAQLRATIEAHRAGGLAPQWVVTSVGIDTSRIPEPLTRTCTSEGLCTVIGVLDGFDESAGTVLVRTGEREVPPAMSAADLAGPIALRLSGTAPIQFLGHVDLAAGDGVLGVPELLAATETAPAGRVVAVDGWLVGIAVPSCGPAVLPDPVPPFDCPPMRGVLTSEPVTPVESTGDGGVVRVPADAVRVQWGAYDTYAADPANDGTNDEPRRGLYLVRMTAVDTASCPACRGWLMVGRLDVDAATAPPATAAPTSSVTLRSAEELEALLSADRASWIGRPVFVDGEIDPGTASDCPGFVCVLGTLTGTGERVAASSYTASLLLPDTDYPTHGHLALVARSTGLEYLGWLGWSDPNGFETTVEDLMDLASKPRGPMVTTVRGWLVAGPATPCPAPPNGVPQDTPFNPCPPAWLTRDEVPASAADGPSVAGVRVQWGAYADFASGATTQDGSRATGPRYGTYVVRLVTDPRSTEAAPVRGWQVVGRLEPAPEIAVTPGTETGPLRTPQPTPEATAGPRPSGAPDAGPTGRARSVAIAPDGRTVTIEFVGGKAYRADDPCSRAYEGWAQVAGDTLYAGAVDVTPPTPEGAAPAVCNDIGYPRTVTVTLPEPFTGYRIEDLAGAVHFLRAPPGLVVLTGLPDSWQPASQGDAGGSPTGRWVRSWTLNGDTSAGASRLDLHQVFGGPPDVTGGDNGRTVTVNGADARLYADGPTGELVLTWSLDGDGLALVANEKDFTEAALIALAESAVVGQRP